MTLSVEMLIQIILSGLTGGAIVKLIEVVAAWRKSGADADHSLVETSGEVIGQWKTLYTQVTQDNIDLRDRVRTVQEISKCIEQELERQKMVIGFLISRASGPDAARAQRILMGEEHWYGEEVLKDWRHPKEAGA